MKSPETARFEVIFVFLNNQCYAVHRFEQSASRQLQTLSGVLSNSNTLPILDHFLELSPGELAMTASDLETMMSAKMERSEDTGAIAVSENVARHFEGFSRHSIDHQSGCIHPCH